MSATKLVSRLLIDGVKIAAPYPVNTTLVFFIELITEQEKQFSSLELKFDKLMIKPFKKGRRLLEEAKYAKNDHTQQTLINDAIKSFLDVVDLEMPNYRLLPIKASLNIGLCYQLLSEKENALRWYQKTSTQLEIAYPDEMKFMRKHEKNNKKYGVRKTTYDKNILDYNNKRKAYEIQKQQYHNELNQYRALVSGMSYLNNNERIRVKNFLIEELRIEELSHRAAYPLKKSLGNRHFPQNRQVTANFSSASRSSNFNPKFEMHNLSQRKKRDQSALLKDIHLLYKHLQIARDAEEDYQFIVKLMGGPDISLPITANDWWEREIKDSAGAIPFSGIVRMLQLLLRNNKGLLILLNPPPIPTKPKAPAHPRKPNIPKTSKILSCFENSELQVSGETVFSKVFGKILGSESGLNREALLFVADFSKLLQVKKQTTYT